MYKGVPQNDVGKFTDVIDNVPKSIGINMLIRSMSPQIIACDEIGSNEDVGAIERMVCSGVKGIFTAHGKFLEDVQLNETLNKLIHTHIFDNIIFLNSKEKVPI